ncbi:MerR family DNA-binding transcriptional regulator [Streptomyces sp. NPDC058734]|uniref:MerR family DNA-binding transcriptional regulator n=1 Tax=Streptomyces sp. NPDC058734 TaxID=3346615 RepID=UPI0036A8ED8C
MSTLRISQLAERSGVPASTLRFYETAGLLPAERTASGYRQYGPDAVERLAFISSAKLLGYAGPRGAVKVFTHARTRAAFDRVIDALHHRLTAEPEETLARGMCFPTRWDPFFKDVMTLADVYRYPTRHFDFHRRQLTLGSGDH